MAMWIPLLALAALTSLAASSPVSTCDRLTSEVTILVEYGIHLSETTQDTLQMMLGFDPLDRTELRRMLCTLSGASNTRELSGSLHELGILFNYMRFTYNMQAFGWKRFLRRFGQADIESMSAMAMEQVLFLRTLEELGLLDLDPEGSALIQEIYPQLSLGESAEVQELDVNGCAVLQQAVEGFILASRDAMGDHWEGIVTSFTISTGGEVDLNDMESIKALACAIAEVNSIQALYDVLYNHLDVARIVGAIYPGVAGGIIGHGTSVSERLQAEGFEFDEEGFTADVGADEAFAHEVKFVNFYRALDRTGLLTLQQFGLPWELPPGEDAVTTRPPMVLPWVKWR